MEFELAALGYALSAVAFDVSAFSFEAGAVALAASVPGSFAIYAIIDPAAADSYMPATISED